MLPGPLAFPPRHSSAPTCSPVCTVRPQGPGGTPASPLEVLVPCGDPSTALHAPPPGPGLRHSSAPCAPLSLVTWISPSGFTCLAPTSLFSACLSQALGSVLEMQSGRGQVQSQWTSAPCRPAVTHSELGHGRSIRGSCRSPEGAPGTLTRGAVRENFLEEVHALNSIHCDSGHAELCPPSL